MLFSYPDREFAYNEIQKEVERHGYHARLIGMGGYNDGLLLAVGSFSDHSSTLMFHKKERGCFLRLADLNYYLVPTPESVLPVCIKLLASLAHSPQEELIKRLKVEYRLVGCCYEQWVNENWAELDSTWKEFGWTPLQPNEKTLAWDRLTDWCRNYVDVDRGRLVCELQSTVWDLNAVADNRIDELEKDFTLQMHSVLKSCTRLGVPLYALDRFHPSYLFNPHLCKSIAFRNYWAVPLLPLENDLFFVSRDYSYGILCFFRPKRFFAFGTKLVQALQTHLPCLLTEAPRL